MDVNLVYRSNIILLCFRPRVIPIIKLKRVSGANSAYWDDPNRTSTSHCSNYTYYNAVFDNYWVYYIITFGLFLPLVLLSVGMFRSALSKDLKFRN